MMTGINHQMVITDDPIEPPAEGELLALARGDADSFCRLTRPLQASLYRQAIALCGDLSLAEDLVSETLVAAWNCLSRYNESCRFSTWLYAILWHRYQKAVRRARSRPLSLAWLPFWRSRELYEQQKNIPALELSPAETATQSETINQLRRCLDLLPEKHRQIIWLRFYEDASLPDIAIVLGCSVGTVKSRLHHALEKLRKMKMNLQHPRGDKPI
jgi:RNA polymerase sigma-70 factor (ECF subfamily)